MRRGELLGLRWEDVDLANLQLRVATSLTEVDGILQLGHPKTGRARTLYLDPSTAAALEREPRGRDTSGHDLVFTRLDGTLWPPSQISDRWRGQWPRLARAGVPKIRLHATRHVHATLLLARGVPIKVVSERLGHTTIAMTMDIYAHVLPAMDRNVAEAIGLALGEAMSARTDADERC
jgi:integrase